MAPDGFHSIGENSIPSFHEAFASYFGRRYTHHFLAGILAGTLLVLDVAVVLGAQRINGPVTGFVLSNAGVWFVTAGLILVGRAHRRFRRFQVDGSSATLPFRAAVGPNKWTTFSPGPTVSFPPIGGSAVNIPPRLPLGAVARVALVPAARRPQHPALVQMTLNLKGGDGLASRFVILAQGQDFGLRNLREFLTRLAPSQVEPGFATDWREWSVARAEAVRKGGRARIALEDYASPPPWAEWERKVQRYQEGFRRQSILSLSLGIAASIVGVLPSVTQSWMGESGLVLRIVGVLGVVLVVLGVLLWRVGARPP